jgi:hypothetical protein
MSTSFCILIYDFDNINAAVELLKTYKNVNFIAFKMIDVNVCLLAAQFKKSIRVNDVKHKMLRHFGCSDMIFMALTVGVIDKYEDIHIYGNYRRQCVQAKYNTLSVPTLVNNIVTNNNNITINNNINNINIFINPYGFETVKHITNEEWKHMIEEGLKQGLAHLTCKTIEKVHSVPENKNFYIENNATKEVTLIGHNDNKYTMTLEELVNKAPSQYMDIIKENAQDMDPVCTIEKKWNRNQQKSTEAHRIIRTLKNVGIQNFQDIIPNELL